MRTASVATVLPLLFAVAACGAESPAAGGAPATDANAPTGVGPEAAPSRPNVVLISIDTLRADHVGSYGYERDTTPMLDELAKESIRYAHAYSTAPWTLIAHMSMLTGLYSDEHNVGRHDHALAEEVPLLQERLSESGYDTHAYVFPGWIHERHGFTRGFDAFTEHQGVEFMRRRVAAMLGERESEQPLFLFLHLFDVHSKGFENNQALLYRPPNPRMFLEDAPDRFKAGDAKALWKGQVKITREQAEGLVGLYDAGVRYVDEVIGGMIEDWRDTGFLDDTLLIITSDHGESLGQRRMVPGHGGMQQEGLHVPLLIRLPGGERGGEVVEDVVSLVDLAPTIVGQTGTPPWEPLSGYDLLGEGRPDDTTVRAKQGKTLAIVSANEKLIQIGGDPNRAPRDAWMADLANDPRGERHIKAKPKSLEFDELREALMKRHAGELERRPMIAFEPITVVLDPSGRQDTEMARLRALGYADEIDGVSEAPPQWMEIPDDPETAPPQD